MLIDQYLITDVAIWVDKGEFEVLCSCKVLKKNRKLHPLGS